MGGGGASSHARPSSSNRTEHTSSASTGASRTHRAPSDPLRERAFSRSARHSRSRPPSDASTRATAACHMLGACGVDAVAAPTGARRLPPLAVVVALEAALLALTALLTDPADDARESAFIGTPPSSARLVVVAAALARIVGGAEHTLPAVLLAARGGGRGGLLAVTTP